MLRRGASWQKLALPGSMLPAETDLSPHLLNVFENEPPVIAVVLTWNSYGDTVRCIESLKKATYPSLDIVLVDNGSTDGSPEILSGNFPDIPLLKLPSNKGYGAGNNAGIRFATGKGYNYILILNNDVVVDPEFLEPMVQAMQTQPSVGVVTCKAFFQSDPARIYTTAGRFSKARCSGIPRQISRIDEDGDASYISGCIMLVKKKVFESVGFFDERFFMYFEDVEFSRRVLYRFRMYYTPKGVVYHKSGGGQRWSNFNSTYLYYTARNRLLTFKDEPWSYRLYVLVYSFVSAASKTIVISFSLSGQHREETRKNRISAIWRGFKDGVIDE